MLEIELKCVLSNPLDAQVFLSNPLLKILETQHHTLRTTYFDTAKALLQHHKMALRIRQEASVFTQTIKKNIVDSVQAVQKNIEWNATLSQLTPDLSKILDQDLRAELAIILKKTELIPLFTTDFSRQTWLYDSACGTSVEIAFDQGVIRCGESQLAICEIELELTGGTNEQVLHDLAKRLTKGIALSTDTSSKAKRGYELALANGLICSPGDAWG